MKLKLILLAALAALTLATAFNPRTAGAAPAPAPLNATDLMRLCYGTEEERRYCTGYIGGVSDMLISCGSPHRIRSHYDAAQLFGKWYEANPSKRQVPAFLAVMRAITWPDCAIPGRI